MMYICQGVISIIDGTIAKVIIGGTSSCKNCDGCDGEKAIWARNPHNLPIGITCDVEINDSNNMFIAVVIFLLPILIFLVTYILTQQLLHLSTIVVFLLSLLLVSCWYLGLFFWSRNHREFSSATILSNIE